MPQFLGYSGGQKENMQGAVWLIKVLTHMSSTPLEPGAISRTVISRPYSDWMTPGSVGEAPKRDAPFTF